MPTPNDMPGAGIDAEQPTPPETPSDTIEPDTDPDGLDNPTITDPNAEIARLRSLVRRNRKWEDKAKQNAEKARLWEANADKVKNYDEEQQRNMTESQQIAAERDRLKVELENERLDKLRISIAAEMKVPAIFVVGKTESEMRDAAEAYTEAREREVEERLKALNIGPAAPASSVTSDGKPTQVKQLTRADLATMSRKDIIAAEKNGQLDEALGRST